MIVFDAGVLIAHLETRDPFHRSALEFLEENEEFEFVVSPLTLAECLVRPAGAGDAQRLLGVLNGLRFEPDEVRPEDALGIAEVRASTLLKLSDALVLHTARKRGADLVTTDKALARAAEARGITAHLLLAA